MGHYLQSTDTLLFSSFCCAPALVLNLLNSWLFFFRGSLLFIHRNTEEKLTRRAAPRGPNVKYFFSKFLTSSGRVVFLASERSEHLHLTMSTAGDFLKDLPTRNSENFTRLHSDGASPGGSLYASRNRVRLVFIDFIVRALWNRRVYLVSSSSP